MSVAVDEPEAAAEKEPSRFALGFDVALRWFGGILSIVLALLSGVLELFLAPLRVAGVLVGVSALAAVVLNVALAWYAVRVVGRRWAIALPWAAWTLLMFAAAGVRTHEGDYLLAGDNWVGMVVILVGSIAFAGFTYRKIVEGALRR